ncbi:hypothetical protein PWEIH_16428 [Listeria weihenstephanensis FSL R9-0317]|nr:hypothetical protein PWEIH_16428 [Listeria weihenstephanensis FSL R9-0317]
MGDIFKRSFLLDDARLLKLGVPRTDYYFDEATLALNKQIGLEKYGINGKKVLLYAPTFRDEALSETKLALDIAAMKQALGEEYKLLLKVHPSMVSDLEKTQDDFCVYADKETEIEALLPMTDVLITDYSSIPFEFSFFEKPMIFFAYDLEEYDGNRGLADHYLETIPGPLCKTTAEVIEAVQNPAVDLEQIRAFGAKWNKYSDGESSKRFVDFLQVELDRE